MCLGENIRYLRRKNNLSQEEMAERLGYKSYTTIQKWEMGTSEPPVSKLRKISEMFNVDMNDIANKKLSDAKNNAFDSNDGSLDKIPFKKAVPILGKIAAGEPIFAVEEIEGYLPVTKKCIDFALRVKGDSMINARIFDGDLVEVQKDAYVNNGDIVVALIDGENATVKRFYQYDDKIILKPENPTMREMEFDAKDVWIIGKVRAVNFEVH